MNAASERIRFWRNNPAQFPRDVFGLEPDAWQDDAMKRLKSTGVNRLCLKACAGPGKTAVIAWAAWWWLSCFGDIGLHPKGAAVATTSDNLRDNLWPELAKWRNRSPFLLAAFEWQKERIFAKDHPNTWFLSARSFSKTASADEQGRSLSGLHSEYPFVLIDESGDIAPAVGRAAEQAMGNCRCGLIIQAGNPTSQDGLLYDSAVTNRKAWEVVSITADPDDPLRTPRVDAKWAKEQIEKYGRTNPWVMAYILGLFPPGSLNSLVSADVVSAALGRWLADDKWNWAAKIIGVDVARFGDDRTVIIMRQGLRAWDPIILRGADTFTIASRVADLFKREDADMIHVDGTGGYGAGVVDALKQAKIPVREVQFSGSPNDPRYFNKRSEMWFEMAEWLKSGPVYLPLCQEIVAELSVPTYSFQNSKFRLEEKDQIKERLGRSPDIGDGLALTFAFPVSPRMKVRARSATQTANYEYNPTR